LNPFRAATAPMIGVSLRARRVVARVNREHFSEPLPGGWTIFVRFEQAV
jgi:hypothetical protein